MGGKRMAFKDPKDFIKALVRERDVLFPRYVNAVMIGVVSRTYEGLLHYTPVLTGRARTNWTLSVGRKNKVLIDGDQLIETPGHWHRTTGEPMTGEEQQRLATVVTALKAGEIGAKVFITNSLSYITILEEGSSMKAPAGMTQVTVDWVSGDGVKNAVFASAKAQV